MDRAEAARLLRQELLRYAQRPSTQLASLVGELDAYEVKGGDGVLYQIEVQAAWEGLPGGPLRVLAGIDDGTLRGAFRPVIGGFVKDPDGTVRMGDEAG